MIVDDYSILLGFSVFHFIYKAASSSAHGAIDHIHLKIGLGFKGEGNIRVQRVSGLVESLAEIRS